MLRSPFALPAKTSSAAVALSTAAFLCFATIAPLAHAGEIEDAIAARVELLREQHALTLGPASIAATTILPEIYARREYRPAWGAAGRLDALLVAIDDAQADGLDPADYHREELRGRRVRPGGVGEAADVDLLATDALVRLAYHLQFGKVDPARLDAHWNFTRTLDREEAVGVLLEALESGRVAELLDRVRPTQRIYHELRTALAAHREIALRGGWRSGPAGPTIGRGDRDARVPALRARLAASGDLAASVSDTSLTFDAPLENALKHFQHRHLLAEDGALGPATRAALDVPVEQRIDQLRVNLERGRWVLQQLPDSFIVVNIAGYRTHLIADSKPVWSARCVVGQAGRQTPIFRADMRYLVFNPTWTVPTGILARDILPKLQKGDLGVLARKKLDVLDSRGRRVSPGSVKWSRIRASSCPYTFRQPAGPDNALGRVKFMFPNEHAVYLHDTPSKDLFESPARAFSSGCIRVERPMELAERLLDDPKWSAAEIDHVVESGKTTTVQLRRSLPVLLLYWTAFPMGGGETAFAPDVYRRDRDVLEALRGPVRLRARPAPNT